MRISDWSSDVCSSDLLEGKRDIVQNAIELAHALGVPEPRVAILSAVETVTAKLQSTLDAAALCKMAGRGQITGGILDGPLAFDNAVSEEAAKTKGIVSAVAGRSEEHTSELQPLMRNPYAVFCLKKQNMT